MGKSQTNHIHSSKCHIYYLCSISNTPKRTRTPLGICTYNTDKCNKRTFLVHTPHSVIGTLYGKRNLGGNTGNGYCPVSEDTKALIRSSLAENTIRNHKAILNGFHQRLLGRPFKERTFQEPQTLNARRKNAQNAVEAPR